MADILKETIVEVPFCGGQLRTWHHFAPLQAYDDPDVKHTRGVSFVRGGDEIVVKSTDALGELAAQFGYSLEDQVEKNPTSFAAVYAQLLDMGRVVNGHELYDLLEPLFGLRLQEHRPRLVDHALHFLVCRFDFDGSKSVAELIVDLRTGTLSKRAFEPRSSDGSAVQVKYRLKIELILPGVDGSSILICRRENGKEAPVPTTAALLVNRRFVKWLRLTAIGVFDATQDPTHQTVVTNDSIDADVEREECVLIPLTRFDDLDLER